VADFAFVIDAAVAAEAVDETIAYIDDPIDFLQDEDGDLDLSTGDMSFSSGLEGVAAAQRQNLQMALGEFFLDLGEGLDYYGSILVKNPNLAIVRQLVTEQLAAAPYVASVDKVALSLNADRELSVRCACTTDFGLVEVDAALVPEA
jgi:hypothetical protein